jgi:hypothetical protein
MGHHHDANHEHGSPELSFTQKGGKLLDHWIQHNKDHLDSYGRWASEFRNHGFEKVADLLESVADMTRRINTTLHEAAGLLGSDEVNRKQ